MKKTKARSPEHLSPALDDSRGTGSQCICDRCQRPLRVDPGRKDAEVFKRAKVPQGVCPDCLITQFLYNTYPINMQLDEAGPALLLKPGIREAFLACGIMEHADLTIDEVNWQRVVDNWSLPVKVSRDGRNPYRMGDAKRQAEARREYGLPEKDDYGGFFTGGERELPPGIRMSGGALIVDGNALRANRGDAEKDELGDSLLGLLDALDSRKEKPN